MTPSDLDKSDHFSDDVATFGDRLTAARAAKGLTVAGLAEKLGVDIKRVEDWERDAISPRANLLQLLAGLLNVSLIWLISGEGNGTSQVADTYDRPQGINDALGEISQLKATLAGALEKLEHLEARLNAID